jgi:hypothetical protein
MNRSRAAQKSQIGGRKRVRLAKRSKGNVVRSPFANARDGFQTAYRFLDSPEGMK